MSAISVDNIYKNIYGENSSQSFTDSSIFGGNKHKNNNVYNILYVDDTDRGSVQNESLLEYSKSNRHMYRMNGGGGKNKDEFPVYARPSDFSSINSEFRKFEDEFQLTGTFSHPNPNGIYICPNESEFKKMKEEVEKHLKSHDIEPKSTNALRELSKNEFMYKSYLFDVFIGNNTNGKDTNYSIPDEFPEEGSNKVLRRKNRRDEVFYFVFESSSSIKISPDKDMSKPTKLKLLGICDHGVVILQGVVPESKETQPREKKVISNLSGGALINKNVEYFRKLIYNANGDVESAAYNFIGAAGINEDQCGNGYKKIAKHYSGDFIHSAFSILFDVNTSPLEMIYGDEDIDDAHLSILNEYEPQKLKYNLSNSKKVLSSIYKDTKHNASDGYSANKLFISKLHKLYSKFGGPEILKADIATAITKKDNSIYSFDEAVSVVNAMDEFEANKVSSINETIYSDNTSSTKTMLMKSLYNSLTSSPFISLYVRASVPLLRTKRSRIRSNKKITNTNEDTITPTKKTENEDAEYINMFSD